MRIAFLWFGFDGRYGKWQDGLYAAMKTIEKAHNVRYFDVSKKSMQEIQEWEPDVVLFWEAPCTIHGKDAEMFNMVTDLPYRKALLFAGGPLKAIDVKDFDLVFVESKINEEDCERQGIPYRRAFGVNTDIFFPDNQKVLYDAYLPATFADWKRHTLFAQAVGNRGIATGRVQEHDRNGYNECIKRGVKVLDEQPAREVARLINSSYCVLNTSEYWGGGQRCTLEAMACGVPVIVMDDSPKNREFVEESGGGLIVAPDSQSIRDAIEQCKSPNIMGYRGSEYVLDHWTEVHYARAIMEGINEIV